MKLSADKYAIAVMTAIAIAIAPALPAFAQEQGHSNTGAVLGGIAGAIIGHQIGNGSGRAAATALFSVAGAAIGDRVDNDRTPPALRQDHAYDRSPAYRPQTGETPRGNTGAVVGGLAGALLGSRIGQGNGRTAAIAALAVTGAIAGDRIENDSPPRQQRRAQRTRPAQQDRYEYSPAVDFNQFATDPRVSVR